MITFLINLPESLACIKVEIKDINVKVSHLISLGHQKWKDEGIFPIVSAKRLRLQHGFFMLENESKLSSYYFPLECRLSFLCEISSIFCECDNEFSEYLYRSIPFSFDKNISCTIQPIVYFKKNSNSYVIHLESMIDCDEMKCVPTTLDGNSPFFNDLECDNPSNLLLLEITSEYHLNSAKRHHWDIFGEERFVVDRNRWKMYSSHPPVECRYQIRYIVPEISGEDVCSITMIPYSPLKPNCLYGIYLGNGTPIRPKQPWSVPLWSYPSIPIIAEDSIIIFTTSNC